MHISAGTPEKVKRHRERMRAAGMKTIQLWVPDTKLPTFVEECRRQSRLVADFDRKDADLMNFMDAALEDLEGWSA
jgi:hypothetical protein